MDSIVIQGGKKLKGDIFISGSKNASLPIMASSILLKSGILKLRNVPLLSDIHSMNELISSLGCIVETTYVNDSLYLKIKAERLSNYIAKYDIVKKFRASFLVLAPILTRFGKARVSLPGGCVIGVRPVDMHLSVLRRMGVDISIDHGYIFAQSSKRLQNVNFTFEKVSVGATITAIFASVCADGVSNFDNCAIEPEIQDLCFCLNQMGAKISNIGTENLKIIGVDELHETDYTIMSDRIEAGTYMIAAAITGGDLYIHNINPDLLEILIEKLRLTGTIVNIDQDIIQVENRNKVFLPTNITTEIYPGFPTDLQAQFLSLLTLASGASEVEENIFENRFMHVAELVRMGADISLMHNKALIRGVKSLEGADVMATDLRASASLVLAALAANNSSKIRRIYHLKRGYHNLDKKLQKCGANIKIVPE